MPKFKPKHPLTEKGFEKLLTKASQPISEEHKRGQARTGTGEFRPSDGCTDKRTSQDKIGDKED